MHALTLTQPWASLVAIGAKKIETRSWGADLWDEPLLIHAAMKSRSIGGNRGLAELCAKEPFASALEGAGLTAATLPKGAIVAEALVECVLPVEDVEDELSDRERAFGDYRPGRFAWKLSQVFPLLEPVSCSGALRLWTPPESILAGVDRDRDRRWQQEDGPQPALRSGARRPR